MKCWIAVLLVAGFPLIAGEPRILLLGGPQGLWGEIVQQWQARYPGYVAQWLTSPPSPDAPADLLFAYFPTAEQAGALRIAATTRVLGVPGEFLQPLWKMKLNADASERAAAYLNEGGIENGVRLLAYLYAQVRPNGPKVEAPLPGLSTGIYHPAAPEVFARWQDYDRWWRQARTQQRGPVVGITFFSTMLRGRDLAAIDAYIAECEAQGAQPLAVFGYPVGQLGPLLQPHADVILALNGSLAGPRDAEHYAAWGIPLLNGIVTRETAAQWQANPKGLPADRMAPQVAMPERSGLIAPALAASTEAATSGVRATKANSPAVSRLVRSALRLAALRRKPNAEKRVALIYYNNPAGRGNIGASYLQVFPSLVNILDELARNGYQTGPVRPDADMLRRNLERSGRNIELWAPAAKLNLASDANTVRWPVEEYRKRYQALPAEFRRRVEQTWGPPARNQLMTEACGDTLCLLIPALMTGNLLLAPQPLRNSLERLSDPAHDTLTPPPHQYIAFYLWLREVWGADAIVHVGRHGTLEWLPGKQVALAEDDAPVVLLADLPNFNIYVMDGGGEAIQAKRRAAATLISHLTPLLARAGARDDIEPLHEAFHKLMDADARLPARLAEEYERTARREMRRLGLFAQLHLAEDACWEAVTPVLHEFLHEIEQAPVPMGLPVFGQSPAEAHVASGVQAYLYSLFPERMHDSIEAQVPVWSATLMAGGTVAPERPELQRANVEIGDWIRRIRQSGAAERKGLVAALAGRYLPSGVLGDALRKPDALPAGRNLHAFDPARLPTEVAWRTGQQMAQAFLERYRKEHRRLPRRVSMVLWYGETERNQGALECMALALLGVRPVWNERGMVESLQLIPAAELGRARVDVVFQISGNYRDGFPDKVQLLDRAVRLAAAEPGSTLGEETARIRRELAAAGWKEPAAAEAAQLRVFGPKPGAYGVGVQSLVEQSGGKDSGRNIAALYLANMSFGYGGSVWGEAGSRLLRANLKGLEAIQISRSSNLYAALDNDDTYQYAGGLRTAIEQVAGAAPDVLVHNLRQANSPKLASLREWLAVELQSRQFNPQWIAAMRDSGYAGAREISREMEHLYGMTKTAPDHVDSSNWQTVLDTFVKDHHRLGLAEFFARHNPHARQGILARLIEVDRQRLVQFSEADRRMLLAAYARSLHRDEAACSAQVCANVKLQRYVVEQLHNRNMVPESVAAARSLARATGRSTAEPRLVSGPRLAPPSSLPGGVAWVRQVRLRWRSRHIPVWVGVGSAMAYLLFVVWRARPRRAMVTSVLSSRA